jgi:hypothetical protein
MITALVLLFPLWALATLAVYGGLVIALFIRFTDSGMDRRELPGVLRGSWKLGLGAMGFLLAGLVFLMVDHARWSDGFDPKSATSMVGWWIGTIAHVFIVEDLAVLTIVPTGWCWIWEWRIRQMQK